MDTKQWTLVITELGGSKKLNEYTIPAETWMGAWRAGRKKGGLSSNPVQGSCCAMLEDGRIRILDPVSRSTTIIYECKVSVLHSTKERGDSAKTESDQPAQESVAERKRFKTIAYRSAIDSSDSQGFIQVGQISEPSKGGSTLAYDQKVAGQATHEDTPTNLENKNRGPDTNLDKAAADSAFELLLSRNEEPSGNNPLTYRERCYLIPEGISMTETEKVLHAYLQELQMNLKELPKGQFVNLAAFDHRWTGRPQKPPLIIMQWKDWRGDIQIAYPSGNQQIPKSSLRTPDHTQKLADAFEALHDLPFLSTPGEGLEFAMRLLNESVPSQASSACLHDINTNELRMVVVTGPGAEERKGQAVSLTKGLFGQTAKSQTTATVFSDVESNPHYDPFIDGRPGLIPRNMLFRPLTHEGHLLGMLQFINREGQSSFSREDVHLVNYVAERLTQFLSTSRLRTENRKP